jgi:hypothetical protein
MPHNETHLSTWQWWSKRRLRYNLALMAAGFTAFVLMNVIETSFEEQFPEYELTAFTLFFTALGAIAILVVANLCYLLGPLSEWLIRPDDVGRYRFVTYGLGFWLSMALPFLVPAFSLAIAFREPLKRALGS